jgi:16S rRNA (uracil1498-N3)-methyltransferase
LQRYFVSSSQVNADVINIHGDDASHITKVMRMNVGEHVTCCIEGTSSNQVSLCRIEDISNDEVVLHIVKWIDEDRELPVSVTIAQGVPKGDKLELVVQKGTELGAMMFLPFFAARSIVKWDEKKGRKKTERLQKIAKEAAEQSHRNRLPEVSLPVSFKELLKQANRFSMKIVAYEEDAKEGKLHSLASALQQVKGEDTVLVVFGPEGGLAEAEITELKQHGFITCALGPRILRTETAPLYFLSAVSYQTELMG